MRRGLSGLACVAYTAPLLGFLGTCWNLLLAFKFLCLPKGEVELSWSWPQESLIPIWLSLVVALPAFWTYRYLCGRVEAYELEMKRAAEDIVSCLEQRGES